MALPVRRVTTRLTTGWANQQVAALPNTVTSAMPAKAVDPNGPPVNCRAVNADMNSHDAVATELVTTAGTSGQCDRR